MTFSFPSQGAEVRARGTGDSMRRLLDRILNSDPEIVKTRQLH